MELWRQCALWLIDCRVLPDNHRVTWEGAQVKHLSHKLTHLHMNSHPVLVPQSNFVCACLACVRCVTWLRL